MRDHVGWPLGCVRISYPTPAPAHIIRMIAAEDETERCSIRGMGIPPVGDERGVCRRRGWRSRVQTHKHTNARTHERTHTSAHVFGKNNERKRNDIRYNLKKLRVA